jgi:hypothetical protein
MYSDVHGNVHNFIAGLGPSSIVGMIAATEETRLPISKKFRTIINITIIYQ